MTKPISAAVLALSALTLTGPAQALMIQLDYSYDNLGFFSGANAARRDLMRAAADVYESRITDTLTAIEPFVRGGSNFQFSGRIERPDTGTIIDGPSSVAFDTVIVYVGGSDDLPATTLGEAGPAGFSFSASIQGGDQDLFDAWEDNVFARGQGDGSRESVSDPRDAAGVPLVNNAFDLSLWGGTISFDNDADWYFDDDPATDETFSGNDFFSVALHELGHVFGVGTSDAWFNLLNLNNATFTGAASSADQNGAVPLAIAGGFIDLGHFRDGVMSTVGGVSQEAALDPSLTEGSRKRMSDLDWAALADIGWDITDEVVSEAPALAPVAVPLPWWPLSGFVAFAFAATARVPAGTRRG